MDLEKNAFEIISISGDAMNLVMESLDDVYENKYLDALIKIKESKSLVTSAHQLQTQLIFDECREGTKKVIPLVMIHAQDHLMNVMLSIQMVEKLIKIFERNNSHA